MALGRLRSPGRRAAGRVVTFAAAGPCMVFSFLVMGACGGGGSGADPAAGAPAPSPTPSTPAAPSGSPTFVDVTRQSNINYTYGLGRRTYNGGSGEEQSAADQVAEIAIGGAAAGDYDNDGDIDVFITHGDLGPNQLYRNIGGMVFQEVAGQAGLAYTKSPNENYAHSGPTFADMDGDGDLDLFLGGLFDDPSKIFRNNGDGTFTDVTKGSGIDTLTARYNVSAAFGDYDLDGDVDLFVSHWGTHRDLVVPGDTQNLWRNVSENGQIKFENVTIPAGIAPTIITLQDARAPYVGDAEVTFTPTFARVDDDLHPDILSVADFNKTMLFMNNRDGTFRNVTDTNVLIDDNGMGSALGDYDNDGDLDWFVSSIFGTKDVPPGTVDPIGNRLYRNEGNGRFTDVTLLARVSEGGWGWGSCFIDFENDGDLDIFHTNGWPLDNPWGEYLDDTSKAFVQIGAGRFAERAADLGLVDREQGRGVVCADFDNDGDTDILLLHMNPALSATLWKNETSGNNYLRVRVRGKGKNTEASGTRIYARVGGTEQMREIMIGSNFISQNPTNVVIFGLGTASNVDELRFQWPDGTVTTHTGVTANQTFEATQP